MEIPFSFDEKELFLRIRNGDKKAFEVLYTNFYGALYLHAFQKLNDREIAKDIVHDLFLTIWQKKEFIIITGNLSSYLHICIKNKIIDIISKEKSKAKYLDSLNIQLELTFETPDAQVREKDLQDQIENILHQLPPRIKEIFILSRFQYLSHKEIALKLNLTEQTVRGYIKDALKVFRMRLSSLIWLAIIIYCKYF
ncbi:RNA polymerase sigma factor [Sphingobacterium daejeonense]|uniref:RNA polymerase sigma factor n=1 Tax=Sphingobacterium daejeonense TaxID=371142 RepID=A0ABW3RNA3_9SPHI|nr:RNA polymerase sigma-70 factor [Sphingobacterium daejeonense]MCT1530476.1 RNA polymerase sigma-70 factor [Sphingobacterium daejeonense]